MSDEAGRPRDPRFARFRELGGDYYASLLAAGYREWYSGSGDGTPYLLQRCIRDDDSNVKRYYLHIWCWDWAPYGDRVPFPVSYAPEVQFGTRGAGPTFNVKLLANAGTPVAEIEAFFAKVYAAMGCEPYGE